MRIKELRPIKLTGNWDASKSEVMESINQLQESVTFDLEKLEQKIDSPTPSPENAVGMVLATAGAFLLSPVLGVGLALMSYESILSAIGNHEDCLNKSRIAKVAKALIEPAQQKNGSVQKDDKRIDLLIKANQAMMGKIQELEKAQVTARA